MKKKYFPLFTEPFSVYSKKRKENGGNSTFMKYDLLSQIHFIQKRMKTIKY